MACDFNNVCGQMMPCFMKCFQDAMKTPSATQSRHDPVPESRIVRRDKPSSQQDLQRPCQNLIQTCQKMMEGINQLIENPATSQKSQNRYAVPEKGGSTENDMMCCCVEVCQHSTDCLKRKEKYDKQKDVQSVGYSGKGGKGLQEQFEDSMKLAEKLTNQCEDLLQRLQKEMSSTAKLLEQLGEQLGSMSKSEKKEERDDGFQMTAVLASAKTGKRSSDTSLTMQVFDSKPNTYTGPEDKSWEDNKFSKPQAQNTGTCCMQRTFITGCQSLDRDWKH